MNLNPAYYYRRLKGMGNKSKVVAKNTIYSFVIKGGSLAISFLSTPFFISYFNNNEILGLWYTLLAVLTWFLSFDLGVGNGMRNHLVKALAEKDHLQAKRIISSGLLTTGVIAFVLAIAGGLLIYNADLNSVFNISEKVITPQALRYSTMMVFASIILRFLLTFVSSIYYALQQAAVNNFLALLVSVLLFAYILIFKFDDPQTALENISAAYLWICNLPVIIAAAVTFSTTLRRCRPNIGYVDRETIRKVMGIGILFFLSQIFYLILSNTNELFVSHYWNPVYAADYGFYYRISMLPAMMISLGLTPLWSMVTKAYTEKDYGWLVKLYTMFKRAGILILGAQLLLVPFMQWIMNIWLGKGVVDVQLNTALAFACFGAVFIYSSMLSTIVCGIAKINLQLWCFGIGAMLKIIFIILVSKISSNWTWVTWSNVFVIAPYCLLQQIDLNKFIRKLL